jgi:hypothetical protein
MDLKTSTMSGEAFDDSFSPLKIMYQDRKNIMLPIVESSVHYYVKDVIHFK